MTRNIQENIQDRASAPGKQAVGWHMGRLRKLCIYAGDEWISVIRLYSIECGGGSKYLLLDVEEEAIYAFDRMEDAVAFAKHEYIGERLFIKIGECP